MNGLRPPQIPLVPHAELNIATLRSIPPSRPWSGSRPEWDRQCATAATRLNNGREVENPATAVVLCLLLHWGAHNGSSSRYGWK
ncbi:hypothetical protein VTO42DRAFT_5409 [Malbranchea cinnamomea]